MKYVKLGATEIMASVAGLGGGGSSRLGKSTGRRQSQSIDLVKQSLDLGVNFFDTARVYGTEEIVGLALKGEPRDSVIVSTKSLVSRDGRVVSGHEIISNLEKSLKSLRMDYVDIFHLHAVLAEDYARVKEELVPFLLRAREDGKIRHLGITESPPFDAKHTMLVEAFENDFPFEVIMVGFHLMHQNARSSVFPVTLRERIGTLIMFAVRSIFSNMEYLNSTLQDLCQDGLLPSNYGDVTALEQLLVKRGGAETIIDAAYRFARHESGADVVLLGTGSCEHMKANINSILRGPLDPEVLSVLCRDMAHLEGIGLDLPQTNQTKK